MILGRRTRARALLFIFVSTLVIGVAGPVGQPDRALAAAGNQCPGGKPGPDTFTWVAPDKLRHNTDCHVFSEIAVITKSSGYPAQSGPNNQSYTSVDDVVIDDGKANYTCIYALNYTGGRGTSNNCPNTNNLSAPQLPIPLMILVDHNSIDCSSQHGAIDLIHSTGNSGTALPGIVFQSWPLAGDVVVAPEIVKKTNEPVAYASLGDNGRHNNCNLNYFDNKNLAPTILGDKGDPSSPNPLPEGIGSHWTTFGAQWISPTSIKYLDTGEVFSATAQDLQDAIANGGGSISLTDTSPACSGGIKSTMTIDGSTPFYQITAFTSGGVSINLADAAATGSSRCSPLSTPIFISNMFSDAAVTGDWSNTTQSNGTQIYSVIIKTTPGATPVHFKVGDAFTGGSAAINGSDMTLLNTSFGCGTNTAQSDSLFIPGYQNAVLGTITDYFSINGGRGCGNSTYPLFLLTQFNGTSNGPPTPPPGGGGTQDPCPVTPDVTLRWVACPVSDGFIGWITGVINNWIAGMLTVPVGDLFTGDIYSAFSLFRDIGVAILVITAMVMVVSQSADLDLFAAHTIRKVLPRLVIAAIGISLAWPLLQFAINFSNDLGNSVGNIIIAAAHSTGHGAGFWDNVTAILLIIIGTIKAIASSGNFGGFMALLGIFALFILAGLIVIGARLIIILLCILTAPLAIALWVLPSTERFWRYWKDSLLTTLLMFPIIMAFLAAGTAAADITNASNSTPLKILAAFLFFIPYLMLPFAFKLAGGIMGQLASLVEGKHKEWAGAKLSAYRAEQAKNTKQRLLEGRQKAPLGALGRAWVGFQRRTSAPGGITLSNTLTRRGRGEWQEHLRKQRTLVGESIIGKEDQGFAANNDTANEIAMQRNMTKAGFIRQHVLAQAAARTEVNRLVGGGMTQANAENAVLNDRRFQNLRQNAERDLATLQTSYGAKIGTDAMRMSAYIATTNSPTSFRGAFAGSSEDVIAGQQRYMNSIGSMVADGLITAEQGTGKVKFAKGAEGRAERGKDSFGNTMGTLQRIADGQLMTYAEARGMQKRALDNSGANDLLGLRDEVLDQAGTAAFRDRTAMAIGSLNVAKQRFEQAQRGVQGAGRFNPQAVQEFREARQGVLEAQRVVDDNLAQIDTLYTYAKSLSKNKGDIIAHNLMGQVVGEDGTQYGTMLPGSNTTLSHGLQASNTMPAGGPASAGSPPANAHTLRDYLIDRKAAPADELGQQFFWDHSPEVQATYDNAWRGMNPTPAQQQALAQNLHQTRQRPGPQPPGVP